MKNVLFLADTGHHTMAVQDHIKAITSYSCLHWFVENPLTFKLFHKLDLNNFDAIGIHYSIKIYNNYYLPDSLKEKISLFNGIKFVFLQDEYVNGNKTISTLINLDIDLLFTLVDSNTINKVYFHEKLQKVKKVTVLTAYVSESLQKIKFTPLENRPVDIFYRSRIYPFSLGRLAQERILIAEGVMNRANQYGLKCDISLQESKRIYGQNWINCLLSARAVLGTESGASIWDATGEITKQVKKLFALYPKIDFTFAYKNLLFQYENNVSYATISPRIFEAAAAHTAMILFPGYYNGILQENIHYICLNKDFSNFPDVVNKLKDIDFLYKLTTKAYNDLIFSQTFSEKKLSQLVENELDKLDKKKLINTHIFSEIITEDLNAIKRANFIINYVYVIISEIKFMIINFFVFLFDSQYSGKSKLIFIFEGFKRYICYISNRIAKNKKYFSL
ncbi:MAG: hypothetical protein REH83_03610 [Rickettsiella sp.]|nr:hypothetical protein [Rickettsiella sp.]